MSKAVTIIVCLIIILSPMQVFAGGLEVNSNDLIDNAKDYDGLEVIYSGEVIGDIMRRGDHTWINVSDGNNAVGIWVSNRDMQDIDTAGRYNMHGDQVKITGIFNRACAEHGGDFDIHANTIEVMQKGYPVSHPINYMKAAVAYVLCILSAVLIIIVFIRKKNKLT